MQAKAKELERGFNLVAVSGGGALSAEGLQMAAARLNAKWSILEVCFITLLLEEYLRGVGEASVQQLGDIDRRPRCCTRAM